MTSIDDEVGRFLDHLKSEGVRDDTLVVLPRTPGHSSLGTR